MNTPDLATKHAEALKALRDCRRAMVTVLRTSKPMGPTYNGASAVMAAIDAFAEILTGNDQHFWIGRSVGPGRADAVRHPSGRWISGQLRRRSRFDAPSA